MRSRVAQAVVVALMAAGLSVPLPVRAQEEARTEEAVSDRVGCWRGRPLPECRSFWLVEIQGNLPVAQTTTSVRFPGGDTWERESFESTLEWNVGHMVNVTSDLAVGGVITVGTGSSDALTGLKLRGRRWMGDRWSVEVEAGGLRTDGAGLASGNPLWGFTTDARLNVKDDGFFFLRYDRVDLPPAGGRQGFEQEGGVHHALSAGAGFGSTWALAGTGALGVLYVVLIALLLDDLT